MLEAICTVHGKNHLLLLPHHVQQSRRLAERSSRPMARATPAGAVVAAFLLLCCLAGSEAATGKRSFGFRVESRDRATGHPSFRRSLLRNSTLPLHGAVKDYG